MKKTMKFLSIFMVMIILTTTSVFATDISQESYDWKYIIYDKDGQIKESGILNKDDSSPKPRYTWSSSQVLNNGEAIMFFPLHNDNGLYCAAGARMKIEYTLNRYAYHYVNVIQNGGPVVYDRAWEVKSVSNAYINISESGYYFGMIRNLSSDPIQVTSFSLTF
ncbi:hypothetical protein QTL86_19420 [Cellulosilyticum sp. ST5]|uniref:hypothetical protein n=1 Tax=Cellulosilyticum sp. ST5 TaxID=3055805 RepID=UPI003977E251